MLDRATSATAAHDWARAAQLWGGLVGAWPGAPARAYVQLAVASRQLGDMDAAERALTEGARRHPREARIDIEWAMLPMVTEDWHEAVRRWETVFQRHETDLTAQSYARLSAAYRECRQDGLASAVLTRGRARFPDDIRLESAWADLAVANSDWAEGRSRWQSVIEHFTGEVDAKAYVRLAACHWEDDDLEGATRVLTDARSRFPDHVEVESAWAQLAMVSEDWDEALRRWETVLERYPRGVSSKAFARLSMAYRRQGDLTGAREAVRRGRERFPRDTRLAGEDAQIAMASGQWVDAIRHWQAVLDRRAPGNGDALVPTAFPRRGSAGDWYEVAWQRIVRSWDEVVSELAEPPDAQLYRGLGLTLQRAELYDDAIILLRRGVADIPGDPALAYDLAELCLVHRTVDDARPTLRQLAREIDANNPVSEVCGALAEGKTTDTRVMLDKFRDPTPVGGLGAVHLVRAPRGSTIELDLKAGRYLSRATIRARVRTLSERDQWPEMHAPDNLVMQRAREIADAFGKRHEDLPYLRAGALADAVLFFVFHEVCLAEPMHRLAADIAHNDDGSPVVIECPTTRFRYLDGYTYSHFDVVYLYFELRRLGVNAFLCRFEDEVFDDELDAGSPVDRVAGQLLFVPGARAMLPRGELVEPSHVSHAEAVIPAGVRSVRRVVAEVPDALVYASGSVVKEFAYDRSIQQAFPVEPAARVHPQFSMLPRISVDLWPAAELVGSSLTSRDQSGTTAVVETSSPLGGSWLGWLDRVLHEYLLEMSAHCVAEVAARGIGTAHICDHIFGESALFADAVTRTGGRVVLWPHSANPVHVDQRRPGSFHEVHAVTRAGVAQWRARFPEVTVHHAPELMLDPPSLDTPVEATAPLTVVVMGGRSSLRDLPILDRSAHERSYKDLFDGLEELQREHEIDVRFKPRGLTGEHEMWLWQIVGEAAGWRPVLEHPMRLQLPNMLYVSVSMGTSALLEGLSRGVPGLVVRDFPVRDYTTIDDDAFPILPVHLALERIAGLTSIEVRNELLEYELAAYRAEFD